MTVLILLEKFEELEREKVYGELRDVIGDDKIICVKPMIKHEDFIGIKVITNNQKINVTCGPQCAYYISNELGFYSGELKSVLIEYGTDCRCTLF